MKKVATNFDIELLRRCKSFKIYDEIYRWKRLNVIILNSCYRYIVDCVTKEEALEMLRKNVPYRKEREDKIKEEGYPAYTTAVSFICLNILGNGIFRKIQHVIQSLSMIYDL